MNLISELAQILSATALGVFAGAMLTEAGVLVPYWRSLSPKEFLQWYGVNGQRLQAFFGPLTIVTTLLALLASAVNLWDRHPGRWLTLLAAVISLTVVSTFFVYFKKANASFSAATISVDQVSAELARWAKWHWWRTALSFAALTAAVLSLWRFR